MARQTTKKQFREFAAELDVQVSRLGLKDWLIECACDTKNAWGDAFTHDVQGDCCMDVNTRYAGITLNKATDGANLDPRRVAKHECVHVLLAELEILAIEKSGTKDQVKKEVEKICRVLERIL
jgi:hypothetical protein